VADPDAVLEEYLPCRVAQFVTLLRGKGYKMDFVAESGATFSLAEDISSALMQKFHTKVYTNRVFSA